MVMGECVVGVGDPTGRIVPPRSNGRIHGTRLNSGYGRFSENDYLEAHKLLGRYPLHTATDFRSVSTGAQLAQWLDHPKPGPDDVYVGAFHFHNFFTDLNSLRHKYRTYGHANPSAVAEVTKFLPEWDMIIRCAKGLPNEVKADKVNGLDRYTQSFLELKGNKPIFFLNETYRKEQHEMVKVMISEEEKLYGEYYKGNNTR
jgi:hypothetical protein